MSEKFKLPDEVLDAISAGLVMMGGQEVTEMMVHLDGLAATVNGERVKYEWTAEFISQATAEGKTLIDVAFDLSAKQNSSSTYDLAEYCKPLS